jgi:chromosome segregation ATPase
MGLLDDFFGKEEINQLKKQLIEKTNEVTRLESSLSTLTNSQLAFEQKVAQLNKAVADGSVSHNALTMELAQSKAEIARQATEFESFKRTASDQKSQTSTTIAELQKTAAAFAPEIAAAKSERDAKANELQRLRAIYDEKDRGYLDREAKLSEKSEKLLQERQKFQQQAMDLHTREQNWKHVIEPQISKYESHVSLDVRQKQIEDRQAQLEQLERALSEREADMVRRQCVDETLKSREAEISEWDQLLSERATELDAKAVALTQKQADLEALTNKLDALSLELAAFRERAAQLDDEAAQIEVHAENIQAKEDEQQAKHAERLTELRQQRTELRKTVKELNLREVDLKEREKTVKRDEALILSLKNKNFELRKEEKRLTALLEECEGEKQEESSSKDFLLKENATLKSRIGELVQSAGKRKAVKESDEIEIGEYDPTKHGGEIAPPPPAFRSNTPLTALHYHVGLSGIDDADERRELLRSIISCSFKQLPKVGSPDYMRQWGEGKSPQRVRCMAYHLSWNIGFQGAKETNELARQHWVEDLKWLTKNYKAKIPASRWPKVPTS